MQLLKCGTLKVFVSAYKARRETQERFSAKESLLPVWAVPWALGSETATAQGSGQPRAAVKALAMAESWALVSVLEKSYLSSL